MQLNVLIKPVALAFLVFAPACKQSPGITVVDVSLKNTDLYEYATVGGDEEGARIVTQATHSSRSEIVRNATTGFVATYAYQSMPDFVGSDRAEIEVSTGSDGASAPTRLVRIVFRFAIHD